MRHIEIGSEFWNGCTRLDGNGVGEILPRGFDTRYVLSGRTALDIIVEDAVNNFGVKSAYLPEYCCHTMIEPFVAHGIKIGFYSVEFASGGIIANYDIDNHYDLVYLIDYFGFLSEKTFDFAYTQKKAGKVVVYDATHSMLCKGINYSECDYVFGSFRKWFGVNAAFCSNKLSWFYFPELRQNGEYVDMRNEAFEKKRLYMSGESVSKESFLPVFSHAEDYLEHSYKYCDTDIRSEYVLKHINCEFIRESRKKNAQLLINGFSRCDSIELPYKKIKEDECPLFVPACVVSDMRNELRSHFIRENIYLPVHWPLSEIHRANGVNADIYHSELSLVCDQRYSNEDMERFINVKDSFFNKTRK